MTRPLASSGPLSLLTEHRTLISQVLVALGVLLVLVLIANRLARRVGGWYFVRRRIRREVRLTAAAFAAPVRRRLRYRRETRLLTRLLADPGVWTAGEDAMRAADAATPGDCRPYAALVGADRVGVLLAGRTVPAPPRPWDADGADPRLWWSARTAWAAPPPDGRRGGRPVLLASVGLEGDRAVFLDLTGGPPVTALYGDERARGRVLQAVTAQLDRRLPRGAVTVAEGVHARHPGPPAAQAIRDAATWRDGNRLPAFAVTAGPLPEPVPPDAPFVLVGGRVRGRARLLAAGSGGTLTVHGTPLRPATAALAAAVARSLASIPLHRPPVAPSEVVARPHDASLGRSSAASAPAPARPSVAPPVPAPAPLGTSVPQNRGWSA